MLINISFSLFIFTFMSRVVVFDVRASGPTFFSALGMVTFAPAYNRSIFSSTSTYGESSAEIEKVSHLLLCPPEKGIWMAKASSEKMVVAAVGGEAVIYPFWRDLLYSTSTYVVESKIDDMW